MTALTAALALLLLACGTPAGEEGTADPTSGSAQPATDGAEEPEAQERPAQPATLYAATEGGRDLLAIDLGAAEDQRSSSQGPAPAGSIATLAATGDGGRTFVSTCCEPASGTWWTWTGDDGFTEGGYGLITDAHAGQHVLVDGNAMSVTVLDDEGAVATRTSAAAHSPVDAALSPDGQHVAVVVLAAGEDHEIRLLSVADGDLDEGGPLLRHTGPVLAVTVDADGAVWAALADPGGQTAEEVAVIQPDGTITRRQVPEGVVDLAFDDSGMHLVTAGGDGVIRVSTPLHDDTVTEVFSAPVDRVDW